MERRLAQDTNSHLAKQMQTVVDRTSLSPTVDERQTRTERRFDEGDLGAPRSANTHAHCSKTTRHEGVDRRRRTKVQNWPMSLTLDAPIKRLLSSIDFLTEIWSGFPKKYPTRTLSLLCILHSVTRERECVRLERFLSQNRQNCQRRPRCVSSRSPLVSRPRTTVADRASVWRKTSRRVRRTRTHTVLRRHDTRASTSTKDEGPKTVKCP
jgi:hypothetical protein